MTLLHKSPGDHRGFFARFSNYTFGGLKKSKQSALRASSVSQRDYGRWGRKLDGGPPGLLSGAARLVIAKLGSLEETQFG